MKMHVSRIIKFFHNDKSWSLYSKFLETVNSNICIYSNFNFYRKRAENKLMMKFAWSYSYKFRSQYKQFWKNFATINWIIS